MSRNFVPFAQERVMSKWENVVDYNLGEPREHIASIGPGATRDNACGGSPGSLPGQYSACIVAPDLLVLSPRQAQ